MTILTITLLYVAIALLWALILDKCINYVLARRNEALEEALKDISQRDAVLIAGAFWPITIPIFIYTGVRGAIRQMRT